MLRPGQTLTLPARSPACVLHLIEGEGEGEVAVDDSTFKLAAADTCCAPGFTPISLRSRHADSPSFVFMADESPLHRKLGLYETRA